MFACCFVLAHRSVMVCGRALADNIIVFAALPWSAAAAAAVAAMAAVEVAAATAAMEAAAMVATAAAAAVVAGGIVTTVTTTALLPARVVALAVALAPTRAAPLTTTLPSSHRRGAGPHDCMCLACACTVQLRL
jgi:DNA-binding LytR/AlgR family response regulator